MRAGRESQLDGFDRFFFDLQQLLISTVNDKDVADGQVTTKVGCPHKT